MTTALRQPSTTAGKGRRRIVNGARISFYCAAHRVAALDRSPVTIYRNAWAYCPHGYGAGHAWSAIEPMTMSQLRMLGPRPAHAIGLETKTRPRWQSE
jgi:hypothetical protein